MHAHAQIEYGSCESFVGFNPENEEDRKLMHDMLDEYLSVLAEAKKNAEKRGDDNWDIPGIGFQVFPYLDTH